MDVSLLHRNQGNHMILSQPTCLSMQVIQGKNNSLVVEHQTRM